ncbi:Centrosomal protein of 135 kDa-like protein [Citrus sinensis]|uniref:Centrosomal protein of 135 kDa-like protein n=1 Tax=Citrus sinensis TaxID=2711 RepID=A0ACB8JSI5_CITSI|nr:Centrosomal protein of 135 kDa-like protein [Citrus sinensis]
MSWLKSAVNKAVEVGGRNNLTRTVRSYADTVVQTAGNAVTEGAKIITDRIGARNFNNFRQTAKRLEEVSVSCRGIERVQLLRRWLVALKEVERCSTSPDNNYLELDDQFNSDSPKKPTVVYYVDPDSGGGEPMNFRDVFLFSQALEGITLSMILEAPDEEEVSLLLEIFGLCLAGGKEVHSAVMSSIQDLATVFSTYQDEVLVKREELLQYAQGAIAGLKINADLPRIDAEARGLIGKLDKINPVQWPSDEVVDKLSEETTTVSTEALKETLEQIQLCSKLEDLFLKKKSLRNGDSPEQHGVKVHKLKIFSESLVNSTSKAEKRILENRSQKEEALHFRLAKCNEVCQLEKDLTVEIQELEKQKDELEIALKKVNTSLVTTRARLRNAKEEREQFDEANNKILVYFKSKEDELSRSIASCRTEANVVNTWINFLEGTWVFQTTYNEKKEKQVRLIVAPVLEKESPKAMFPRKFFEEEYLNLEAQFLTTLSIVATIQNQFYAENEGIYRKDNEKVKELFDTLEKIKTEFESIKRPILDVETSSKISDLSSNHKSDKIPSFTSKQVSETLEHKREKTETYSTKGEELPEVKVEVDILDSESENDSKEASPEDIKWEFDAFDKDIKPSG